MDNLEMDLEVVVSFDICAETKPRSTGRTAVLVTAETPLSSHHILCFDEKLKRKRKVTIMNHDNTLISERGCLSKD